MGGQINEYRLHPSDFGLELYDRRAIEVQNVEESKEMILAVLGNRPGPARSIAALNAGIDRALQVIESGEAKRKLDELVAFTKKKKVA